MDRISFLIVTLVAALIAVVDVASVRQVDYRQRRQAASDYDDNEDDDLTFSGDVSSGSGMEPTGNSVATATDCRHKDAADCIGKRQSVYGTGSKHPVPVTQKTTDESAPRSTLRSQIFGPVRPTVFFMTSSRPSSRARTVVPPDWSGAGQSLCGTLMTGDCIGTVESMSGSTSSVWEGDDDDDDDDIVLVEDPEIGTETATVARTERRKNANEAQGWGGSSTPSTTVMTSSAFPANYLTKSPWNAASVEMTSSSMPTSETILPNEFAVDRRTTAILKSNDKQHSGQHVSYLFPDTQLPVSAVIGDHNTIVVEQELDVHTTTATRFRPSSAAHPSQDGVVVPQALPADRYAALALNVALLIGIAFLVVVFAVVLVCLVIYRHRRTRCGSDDVMTPVTCHHGGGGGSGMSPQPSGALAGRRLVDARKPPPYQTQTDDRRPNDMDSCRNNGTGGRVKVGDPKEWFV